MLCELISTYEKYAQAGIDSSNISPPPSPILLYEKNNSNKKKPTNTANSKSSADLYYSEPEPMFCVDSINKSSADLRYGEPKF